MRRNNIYNLSAHLAKRRREKKLSMEDMALLLGISRKTYGLKENDPEKFTLGELIKTGNYLNIKLTEFMEGN